MQRAHELDARGAVGNHLADNRRRRSVVGRRTVWRERPVVVGAVIVGVVFWMTVFAFVPNILVFLASFCTTSTENFIEPAATLRNYARLMDRTHLDILLGSLRLSGLVTTICLLTAYPFASILARARKPVRGTLLLLVVIPFWTNSLVRTYAMTAMLNSSGIVNNVLLSLGLIDAPLAMMYTPGAVVLGLT